MTSRTRGALCGAACLIAATAPAPLAAQIEAPGAGVAAGGAASGALLIELDGAAHVLGVWAPETAHAPAGEGHALTVWATDGEGRDFEGDAVIALTLAPDGEGWAASGQITRLEGLSFHGAILDSEFGAAFEVLSLGEAEGRLRLALGAAGPAGRAQGDTGQNDFASTVPGRAVLVLDVPLGAPAPPPPE